MKKIRGPNQSSWISNNSLSRNPLIRGEEKLSERRIPRSRGWCVWLIARVGGARRLKGSVVIISKEETRRKGVSLRGSGRLLLCHRPTAGRWLTHKGCHKDAPSWISAFPPPPPSYVSSHGNCKGTGRSLAMICCRAGCPMTPPVGAWTPGVSRSPHDHLRYAYNARPLLLRLSIRIAPDVTERMNIMRER